MRIIVTGGAGFIGSHVCDAYAAAGHDVLVVDSLWEHGGGRRENVPANASFERLDVRDERLGEVFERFKPDVVNHHAAQHSVAISSRDPAYDADVNVLGLINVLQSAVKAGARTVQSSGLFYTMAASGVAGVLFNYISMALAPRQAAAGSAIDLRHFRYAHRQASPLDVRAPQVSLLKEMCTGAL